MLTLPDGRDLAYAEYGPPDGTPIVVFPGFGHDRFGCFPPAGNVRILAIDRPGIGASSRQPGRTILRFAEDVEYLLDQLRIGAATLMAWSAGSPYALAACARMRDRVKAATLVSAIAPPGMGIPLAGMDPVLHGMWRLAGISRALIAVQLATLRFQAQHHSELLLHSLYVTAPRCDRDIVALPEVRAMLSRRFRTASAPGRCRTHRRADASREAVDRRPQPHPRHEDPAHLRREGPSDPPGHRRALIPAASRKPSDRRTRAICGSGRTGALSSRQPLGQM
jgi:pimeloyl-ACP methyl ester carboxylesterase